MRWPDVIDADMAAMEADERLMELLAPEGIGRVTAANDGDVKALKKPCIEYTIISAVDTENLHQVRVQWDVFADRDQQMVDIERCLYRLFHRDTGTIIGGLPLQMSQYVERREMLGMPDGIRGSSTEYVQVPARLRYVREPVES